MLPGFIRPEAQPLLAAQANAVADRAFFCDSSHNAYLDDASVSGHNSQASMLMEETCVGSVAYDNIGQNSMLRQLYLWDPLTDFLAAVLGKDRLFRSSDPLGACSINVFSDGGRHGWHFDESEFTITIMLQPPESGGEFEYVPGIRGTDDETDRLTRILNGEREGVVELPFTAGTLLIFGGRDTLHRVAPVRGDKLRLVPVLCYSESPEQQNSIAVRKLFWGRTGPETGVEL